MKFACFNKVGLIAVFLIASANTLPVSFVNSDSTFRNLNRNYQVVDGPKEFLVPLAPLRNLWGMRESPFTKPEGSSDLEYMVYGKVYLMKALGIADRSLFSTSVKQDITSELSQNKDINTIVLTRDSPQTATEKVPSKDDERIGDNEDEGIQFPVKNSKRQYRYKFLNTPKPNQPNDASSLHHPHLDIRKIQERSAESLDVDDNETSNKEPLTASKPTTEGDSDDEALELLEKFAHYSPLHQPHLRSVNENKTSGGGAINVDDRFLLQVPNKPQSTQCPEGQRRTHHGQCKPVVVHNRSPQDGIYKGRLTTSASPIINGNSPSNSSSHLAALFKTFVQLEKKLENALKDSETKLAEMFEGGNASESSKAGETS